MDRNTQNIERDARQLRRQTERDDLERRQQTQQEIRNIRSQREVLLSERIADRHITMGERQRQLVESAERTFHELRRQDSGGTQENNRQQAEGTVERTDDNASVHSRDSVFTAEYLMDTDYELSILEERMEQNRQRLSTVDFNRKRIRAVRDDEASVKSEEGGQNGTQRFNKDRPQDTSYRDGCSVDQARMANSRQQISQDSSDHRATSQTNLSDQSLNERKRGAYLKPPSWQDEDVHSVASESDHVLRNNTHKNQNRTSAQRDSVNSMEYRERSSINREIGNLDESLRRLNVEEYDRERRMTDDASRRNLSRNSYDKQSMPVRSFTQNRGSNEGYCPQYRSDTLEIEPGSRIQKPGLRDIEDRKMLPDKGSYSKKGQARYESDEMSTHGRHDDIEQKGALEMDRRKRELDLPGGKKQAECYPSSYGYDRYQSSPLNGTERNNSFEEDYKRADNSQTTSKQRYYDRQFEEEKMKEMEMEAQRKKLLQLKKAQEEMKKQEEVKKQENMEKKVRYNVQDGSAAKERFCQRETIREQERPNTQIQGNQYQFGNTIMPQQRGDERKFANLPSEEIDWKDKTQKGDYGNVRFKDEENQERQYERINRSNDYIPSQSTFREVNCSEEYAQQRILDKERQELQQKREQMILEKEEMLHNKEIELDRKEKWLRHQAELQQQIKTANQFEEELKHKKKRD